MTHRVHPKAFRIKYIDDWDSRGFYEKNFSKFLEEDFRIREFLRNKLEEAGLEKIEIERSSGKINIIINSLRPGLIIGRGGQGTEELKKELINSVLKKESKKINLHLHPSLGSASLGHLNNNVPGLRIEIREIKNPWTSATLVASWIARQIEKRVPYRRVLKQALSKVTAQKAVKGARVEVAGRLNGIEISRREWLQEGSLPRQTLRIDIDYNQTEAYCSYGVIGVKVWIYVSANNYALS
ncbi:MAG: 30S ribosomal protein S3 [Candidatus Nealsonbacteria bacterium CG03_land_8_20_14_0_80_36_12]|uniref:Small ribosomal subunit protein uS3 n=1 Tax=Candidatus Nealsonbacteria bacterium CG03_land_8_20_14_0_80_36_12 TaxID=1974701 RepID=A0A2M7BYL8_9BACT|nr:MAG: 30S ribosomal protein S3 [Candidatus Nealsonbacteria bacterium CG03_land_8_20_14_0_80_36_12]